MRVSPPKLVQNSASAVWALAKPTFLGSVLSLVGTILGVLDRGLGRTGHEFCTQAPNKIDSAAAL
jgi:hypothetical protein